MGIGSNTKDTNEQVLAEFETSLRNVKERCPTRSLVAGSRNECDNSNNSVMELEGSPDTRDGSIAEHIAASRRWLANLEINLK